MKKANRLIDCTSPYLLQHAYNPVDWYPWGEEALNLAKKQDKPIILSIGYSSCHWCHVMEKESFEKDVVAKLMNEHFVCIKLDREERPDIDQIYMDAVQAMGLQGGWPLNVFLTPEKKPFYGGTYFPQSTWMRILQGVAESYRTKKDEILKSAEDITEFLKTSDLATLATSGEATFDTEILDQVYQHLDEVFDSEWGGREQAPKFPMPSIWRFMLRYHLLKKESKPLDQVVLTLDRMANGGIYDLVGGGFARYSVDEKWMVPHFEKMLYDNGQLLSLYAEALQLTGKAHYRQVILRTCEWLRDEMTSPEGLFYSALDADSEGVEGKFYTWTIDEIEIALEPEAGNFKKYFRITSEGNWEKGMNVLFSPQSPAQFAREHELDPGEFVQYLDRCYRKLAKIRAKRVRPGLDNKSITAWNGITLEGLVNAYRATGEEWILEMALRNANVLKRKYIGDGTLYRVKDDKQAIPGFLDDYAYTILSFSLIYEVTFDESWLNSARELVETVRQEFTDPDSNYFYYSPSGSSDLINRKKEMLDNVIPASNSVLALALQRLGLLLSDSEMIDQGRKMAGGLEELMNKYPEYLTNWACLLYNYTVPAVEAAVAGAEAKEKAQALSGTFLPNKVIAGTMEGSELPLLRNRSGDGKTLIYICREGACQLPVEKVEQALTQIREIQD